MDYCRVALGTLTTNNWVSLNLVFQGDVAYLPQLDLLRCNNPATDIQCTSCHVSRSWDFRGLH